MTASRPGGLAQRLSSMSKRTAARPLVQAFSFLLAVILVHGVRSHAAARPFQSVAVTLAEDGGAYYEQIVRGAEHGAREVNPRVTFAAMSCQNNADTQMRQIDELVQRGVDVIIIQRSYQGDSSPAVQRARKAGVTVVAVDVTSPAAPMHWSSPTSGRAECWPDDMWSGA